MSHRDSITGQRPAPFVPQATHQAGEILYLPSNTITNDGKEGHRPHVLLNQVGPDDWGTLVYGSRQPTEESHGARVVEVHPNGEPDEESEYWYPGIIIPKRGRLLDPGSATDGELLDRIRQRLPEAIGRGTGTCRTLGGFGRTSWRGRIIRVNSRVKDGIGTDLGVVVTEHVYSTQERWQVMVPLYFAPVPPAWGPIALNEKSDWAKQLNPTAYRVIAGVAVTISVGGAAFRNRQIDSDTGIVMDDADIERVERRLLQRLLQP